MVLRADNQCISFSIIDHQVRKVLLNHFLMLDIKSSMVAIVCIRNYWVTDKQDKLDIFVICIDMTYIFQYLTSGWLVLIIPQTGKYRLRSGMNPI